MRTIVLDPMKWYRGQGADNSYLLDDNGNMCCLGFTGREVGATDEQMFGLATPYSLVCNIDPEDRADDPVAQALIEMKIITQDPHALPRWRDFHNSTMARGLFTVNDDPTPQLDRERVDRLNEVLTTHDAPFRFALKEDA